jgi:hypothetical protein
VAGGRLQHGNGNPVPGNGDLFTRLDPPPAVWLMRPGLAGAIAFHRKSSQVQTRIRPGRLSKLRALSCQGDSLAGEFLIRPAARMAQKSTAREIRKNAYRSPNKSMMVPAPMAPRNTPALIDMLKTPIMAP